MKYVTVRLTLAQARAANNACDLVRNDHEADGDRREAAMYQRASQAIDAAINIGTSVRRAKKFNARASKAVR